MVHQNIVDNIGIYTHPRTQDMYKPTVHQWGKLVNYQDFSAILRKESEHHHPEEWFLPLSCSLLSFFLPPNPSKAIIHFYGKIDLFIYITIGKQLYFIYYINVDVF